ncbi:ATP synthase F1 subunit delta [Thermoanaerobacterium butyriciformans]|uniref:ATP synthase subunit delta n=1 Tax=Thermoanaerobacterium butyriciformans TaxID=1702242 RepID=A0ABS4NAG4_9THEO|nr:ATP synthase F1 subunit delta [Thermoanaerobacterium butyriciformans]MBP2070656.1 F-type H+-transporting ATPase subunit delta [Thermoanaerobacterium butyriciformans]
MEQVIAKKYARALFNAARENNNIEKYYDELKDILNVLKNKQIYKIITNRGIYIKQKMSFVDAILDGYDKEIINFLKLIISKHRETIFDEIFIEYEKLYMDYKGIINATLISAHPLDLKTIEEIRNKLESNFNKKVSINQTVDESILGGLKILIGNKVIDGSIKGKLDLLLKNLVTAS